MRKLNKFLTLFIFAFTMVFASTLSVSAAPVTLNNEGSGYALIIDDEADFLTDSEEDSLKDLMLSVSDYCNVACVTTTSHSKYSTEDFAADYLENAFGSHPNGTIFVIDRCLNEIFLYSDGQAHKTITNSRATSITDNTYIYATDAYDRDYYTCAYKTFEQILALMEGRRIAEPMKYICSALIALILALMLNYFIVMSLSRSRKPNAQKVIQGTFSKVKVNHPSAAFVRQTRVYSPPSSSSGGSHSGGGGGGHSGGGGGHSI